MSEQSLSKLSQALVAASAEMPAVAFDETNPFLNNKFASLGAVIATARPILAKHGLAIMQFACSNEQGHVGVRTRLLHSSGEWLEESIYLPLHDEKGKSQAQVAGSIITYLRRYAQSSILNLYADQDTDGTGVDSTHRAAIPPSTPNAPAKPPVTAPGAQGGAKGSAPPTPKPDQSLACKARFLQIIAEKQWGIYAWSYAVSQGWILETERLEDARPEKFPQTAADMAKIETAIKRAIDSAAESGGISQEEQEAYDAAHLPPEVTDSSGKREWWMDIELHFGPQKGTKLMDLDRNKLFGWAKNYQPKPFKGKIGEQDGKLRKALDDALSWLEENKDGNKSEDDDEPPF